jgi:CBS domain-containing protein
MVTTAKPGLGLVAEDVMSREVVTITRQMKLCEVARTLRLGRGGGAPVIDEKGRCVGVLTVPDFLRWAEEWWPGETDEVPACRYQVKGRLLTGEEAVICTLAEGSCPLQAIRPTTGGRHTAVCLEPRGVLSDWQQVVEKNPAGDRADRYMTTDIVFAGPQTPLPELARRMIEARLHTIPVLDEQGRPVGVVCSTDVLAVAADWLCEPVSAGGEPSPFDEARFLKEYFDELP